MTPPAGAFGTDVPAATPFSSSSSGAASSSTTAPAPSTTAPAPSSVAGTSTTSDLGETGPPGWAMLGELASPRGLSQDEYDYCATAAGKFGEIAARLKAAGTLQQAKTLAIIRTWDVYCFRHKVDITCGAASSLLRVLAFPGPQPPKVEEVQEDLVLASRPRDELLDPAFMPAYVAGLLEGGAAAVCGFVFANGAFRLWADENFSSEYFDTEEANARFAATSILPSLLFGVIVSPASRATFYELLVQYLLTETKGTTTMRMVTDTVGRDGGITLKLLRVRYMVLNQGQYACFAMNLLPMPSVPASSSFSCTLPAVASSSSSGQYSNSAAASRSHDGGHQQHLSSHQQHLGGGGHGGGGEGYVDGLSLEEAEADLASMFLDEEEQQQHLEQQPPLILPATATADVLEQYINKEAEQEQEQKVRERMAPLTEEGQEEIRGLLRPGGDTVVVVSGFNVHMLRQDIRTCAPSTWLNDEVINFFMNLLKERDDALVAAAVAKGKERRKNWFFSSFFISKLLNDDKGYKYENVKRWSQAGDLFTYDKVFFPINIDNSHWCLAVIHMQEKEIQYFNSMKDSGLEYLLYLHQYLQDEHQDKKNAAFDASEWKLVSSNWEVVPQQTNGFDCGCFATAFAYLLSEGLPIEYISQADMPAFRQRLVMSIIRKKLDL